MGGPQLQQEIRRLARAHPGAHPFTLALHLEVETGAVLSGRAMKEALDRGGTGQG